MHSRTSILLGVLLLIFEMFKKIFVLLIDLGAMQKAYTQYIQFKHKNRFM